MNTHTDIHGPLGMFSFLHDKSVLWKAWNYCLRGKVLASLLPGVPSVRPESSSFSSNHPWMQTLICPWFWLLMVSPEDKAWFFHSFLGGNLGFPCGSAGKESTCHAGDLGLIPGLGRSPGERKGYPLQCSGLENSMGCIVRGVAKSRTRLSLSLHGNLSIMDCVPGPVMCSL